MAAGSRGRLLSSRQIGTKMKPASQAVIRIFLLVLGLGLAAALSACQSTTPPAAANDPTGAVTQPVGDAPVSSQPQATADPKDPAAIQVAWQASAHANTFVLNDANENTACARCHSPANWQPTMDDLPESCYSCKFEVQEPDPVVEQAKWENIQCNICHKVDKKKVDPKPVWLEIPQIDEYVDVASNSELCLKCHSDVDVPGHAAVQVAGAHAQMNCTDCHDAHSTTASCATAGCHTALESASATIPGHDERHKNVSCVACHDGAKMEIGPGAGEIWTTFLPASTSTEKAAFSSHNLVKDAPCERCHFSGNSWGLKESVTASQ